MAAAAVRAIRKKNLAVALAEARKAETMSVFDKYDADGGGTIDEDELLPALKDLGMPVTIKQCRRVLKRFGGEKAVADGLDREQFNALVAELEARQARSSTRRESGAGADDAPAGPRWHALFPTWKYHDFALQVYMNKWVQLFVATMIVANFLVNVAEKEIDPFPAELQRYSDAWEGFDTAFNIIFLVEILLNMWGNGGPYKKFWSSGWNVFDFIVVLVGLLLMSGAVGAGSPLGNLKMMRAFRVFRLFKRIESLNKVIMALLKAIPGVSNAFIIMVIFMMIYAILAVEYFSPLGQDFCRQRPEVADCQKARDWEPTGYYVTYGESINGTVQTHLIEATTSRGYIYGWEYYGTFTRALFTLFQVMTGESWSEAVARPLMFGLYQDATMVVIFFVSFILLTQIVLTNVVVAVLLDKFVEPEGAGAEEAEEADAAPPKKHIDASDFLGPESVPSSPDGRLSKTMPARDSFAASPEDRGLPPATILPSPALSPEKGGSSSSLEGKVDFIVAELTRLHQLKAQSDAKLEMVMQELTRLQKATGRWDGAQADAPVSV